MPCSKVLKGDVMSEIVVERFTHDALLCLRNLANSNPEIWLDPDTNFIQILSDSGIDSPCESTSMVFHHTVTYFVNPDLKRPNNADTLSEQFYSDLDGMTPRIACFPGIWEWFAHTVLHKFCIDRFPISKAKNLTKHIIEHYFAEDMHRRLHTMNVASRLWWLAHTAHRASNESEGAYNASAVIQHFAEHAQHYHIIAERELFRNDRLLSEFIRVLLVEAQGISNNGVRELWRRLNIIGGGVILDALPREQLRDIIQEQTEEVMSDPPFVQGRNALRNPDRVLRVLSLGAGVQSSVLALMADKGEYNIEKPDFAIFADTGWEPPAVYEHLNWLKTQLSFEVITVSAGNILDNVLNGVSTDGHKFLVIPAFTVNPDGTKGRLVRQCTSEYKIVPIHSFLRERLGLLKGQRAPKNVGVIMMLGISIDEAERIKPSRFEWVTHEFPLVDRDFSRAQLINWFNNNYPSKTLPKSSCIGCPYHSNAIWKQMKDGDPNSFLEAVDLDKALRNSDKVRGALRGTAYLHASRKPLNEVDFSAATGSDDLLVAECEGLCGI